MTTIVSATFREALKKKIILLIGLMTLAYIVILTLITWYGFSNMKKCGAGSGAILSNAASSVSLLGFYMSSMITSLLTIMASLGSVSSELESGVIYSVISRPIKRCQYIIEKYIGLAILSAVYSAILYLSIILINYIIGVPPLEKLDIPALAAGLALFVLEPLVILAVSIWGSVSFKTINNGIFVIAIYILGILGSMMEQIGAILKFDALVQWGIITSFISPFDSIYRKMIDVVFSASDVPLFLSSPLFLSNTTPSIWMIVYSCIFLTALLCLAIRKFNRMDIK